MDKTLHQKLTSKAFYVQSHFGSARVDESVFTGLIPEMKILQQAAKDLLSPRSEAIDQLLRLSRSMHTGN